MPGIGYQTGRKLIKCEWGSMEELKNRSVESLILAIKAQAVEGRDAGRVEYTTTPHEVEILSRISELEKDKRRLDWLSDKDNHVGNVQLPKECVMRNLGSLRGAIDEAME